MAQWIAQPLSTQPARVQILALENFSDVAELFDCSALLRVRVDSAKLNIYSLSNSSSTSESRTAKKSFWRLGSFKVAVSGRLSQSEFEFRTLQRLLEVAEAQYLLEVSMLKSWLH